MCVKVAKVKASDVAGSRKDKCMELYRNECGAFVRATKASLQGVAKLIAIPAHFGGYNAIVMEYCGR